MRSDHAAWRERVLAYEELDPGERTEVDAHLESCASCRELLQALRERESLARLESGLPLEPAPLAGPDAAGERASVERLLERLAPPLRAAAPGAGARVRGPVRRPRMPAWAWLAPAVAAAAVALVWWGVPGRDRDAGPRLGPLAIERASTMRGAGDAGFRTGDAFSIRFDLSAAARPIVVALDDAGVADVLYPSADSAARPFPAGTAVLPDPAGGELWTFSGPPGRETFLAGSLRGVSVDLAVLRAELARATAAAPDRAARVRAARLALERHAGSIREITVTHAAPAPR